MFKLGKPKDNQIVTEGTEEGLEVTKEKNEVWKTVKEKTKAAIVKVGKRNAAIALAVLIIGGAVWLNIALFSKGLDKNGSNAEANANTPTQNTPSSDDTASSDLDGYFASTQVERKRSRDEALEVLRLVVESSDALEESKNEARAEMSQIALDIDNEAKIESLVTAKGFDKCIAVISSSKCNVIVKTSEALLPNQVAQIQEIVYEQSGILPVNVKIIEKNAT